MRGLSPVHTTNNVQATLSNATSLTIFSTMSNVASTLLPFLATMLPVSATMSNEISSFRQSRHILNMFNLFRLCRKDENSFDVVAVCGNKVECRFDKVERSFDNVACCFDVVAGVDGALRGQTDGRRPGGGRMGGPLDFGFLFLSLLKEKH